MSTPPLFRKQAKTLFFKTFSAYFYAPKDFMVYFKEGGPYLATDIAYHIL
jgi:hypothetical protein